MYRDSGSTMRVILLFLIVTLYSLQVTGKEYEYMITGRAVDNISGKSLQARVFLMTADSTVIDSTQAEYSFTDPLSGEEIASYEIKRVLEKGRYILKATMDDYNDAYMNVDIRSYRESHISVNPIRMLRISHELPEVLVKATKIKMVMRGDTIVYNATAFNLAEGSMLDALIARLPGAKLTSDGKIYVNGQYIESLLVNGHDFFAGDPKVALENLPAYTVNRIKVYNKEGLTSTMMGRNMGDHSFVMDVRLKKEYATNWMGNIEAGVGTHQRYKTRGFGMRFSDKERIGAYYNINNLNDNQKAELSGEWKPQDIPDGLLATKTAGLAYVNYLDGYDKWVTDELTFSHVGADNEARQETQTYLHGGDSYLLRQSKNTSSIDRLNNNFVYHTTKDKKYYSYNHVNLSYARTQGMGYSAETVSDIMAEINQMISDNSHHGNDLNVSIGTETGFRTFVTDMFRVEASFGYNRRQQKTFSRDQARFFREGRPMDYRNSYLHKPQQEISLAGGLSYNWQIRSVSIQPQYKYRYTYNKHYNDLYRLDKIIGRDSSRFDILPSTREALAQVIDRGNSYRYHEYRNEHLFNLHFFLFQLKAIKGEFLLNMPVRMVNAHLHYTRTDHYHLPHSKAFVEPDISLRSHSGKIGYMLSAGIKSDFPDLTSMIDYRDDSNPLSVFLGNPDLKNLHRYYVDLNLSTHRNQKLNFSLWANYHQTDHSVAYSLSFNKSSGISTMRPVSVNGNWDLNGGWSIYGPLDKDKKLSLENRSTVNYNHCVDMASVEGYAESVHSIVNNWKIGDELKLNYRANDDLELTLHGGADYYLIDSKRSGFTHIRAGDYSLGANAQVKLPWGAQLTSDITMFARRGYHQTEMNTTDWVWNAQISKAICKGKLFVRLQGFDILHQLSNRQLVMNSQGKTETWRNSIPQYYMLSLAWRFLVKAQKKDDIPMF